MRKPFICPGCQTYFSRDPRPAGILKRCPVCKRELSSAAIVPPVQRPEPKIVLRGSPASPIPDAKIMGRANPQKELIGVRPHSFIEWKVVAAAGAACMLFIAGLIAAGVLAVGSKAGAGKLLASKGEDRSLGTLERKPIGNSSDPPPSILGPHSSVGMPPLATNVIVSPQSTPEEGRESKNQDRVSRIGKASPNASIPDPPTSNLDPSSSIVDPFEVAGSQAAAPSQLTTTCQNYGTQVDFVSTPAEATQRALQERKLLFLLHLSGNLEDAKFT